MPISAPPKWTEIKNKPTTMAGYGITDEKCRAWVNFNGTGTVAIRASNNVSSITDNGVGNYTVNFGTSMPDANYSTFIGGQAIISTEFGLCGGIAYGSSPSTNAVNVAIHGDNGVRYDVPIVNASIFR